MLDVGAFDAAPAVATYDPWMSPPRADPWAPEASAAVHDPWTASPSQPRQQKQVAAPAIDPWMTNVDSTPGSSSIYLSFLVILVVLYFEIILLDLLSTVSGGIMEVHL